MYVCRYVVGGGCSTKGKCGVCVSVGVCVATDCSAGAVMVLVVRETPQPVPLEVSLCGYVMRRPAS